ncbi:MAG: hypothetical protein A2Z34_04555 [Planctomycetes bacterium RBG_16_59_8]|nr:MAG: hypothetical protein A2Z34_04555 [Planctomycetes bacterium RBG_16_59_8]
MVEIGEGAVPHLINLLGGDIPVARKRDDQVAISHFVAEALVGIAVKSGKKEIVGALRQIASGGQGGSPGKRAGAIIALGKLPPDWRSPEDIAAIESGLSGSVPEMIVAAANSLAAERSVSSLQRLSDALASAPDDNVKTVIVLAVIDLDQKGNNAPVSSLVSAFSGAKSTILMEYSLAALGIAEDVEAIPTLIKARISPYPAVVAATSKAVVRLPKEKAVALLRDELKNKDYRIRQSATLLLGDIGEASVAKALLDLLVDPNPPRVKRDPETSVRVAAAAAIGKIKPKMKNIVEGLINALKDPDDDVRQNAYTALKATTGMETIEFDPVGKDAQRKEAIKKWELWFKVNGDKVFEEKKEEDKKEEAPANGGT